MEARVAGLQYSSLQQPQLQPPRAGNLDVNTVCGGEGQGEPHKGGAVSWYLPVNREQARSFQKEVGRDPEGFRERHEVP